MYGNGRRIDFNSDNLNLDLISIFLWATIYFKFGMNVNFN